MDLPSLELCYDWWPHDLRRNVSKLLQLAALLAAPQTDVCVSVVFKSALFGSYGKMWWGRGYIFLLFVDSGRNPDKWALFSRRHTSRSNPGWILFSPFCIDLVAFLATAVCSDTFALTGAHRPHRTFSTEAFPWHFLPLTTNVWIPCPFLPSDLLCSMLEFTAGTILVPYLDDLVWAPEVIRAKKIP